MPGRKEKPIFEGVTVAIAGELGGQWTDTNVARWVHLRGGKLVQTLEDSVTHLVCSADEFKARGAKGTFSVIYLVYLPYLSCLDYLYLEACIVN